MKNSLYFLILTSSGCPREIRLDDLEDHCYYLIATQDAKFNPGDGRLAEPVALEAIRENYPDPRCVGLFLFPERQEVPWGSNE